MVLKNTTLKLLLVLILFPIIGIGTYGCKGKSYSFTAFSYPPGSEPHEDNWEYHGKVIVSSLEVGPLTRRTRKTVQIIVQGRSKDGFLSDKLDFVCASIESSVQWDVFDEIEIILYEVGNEFAEDEYNKKLIKKGRNPLSHLKYVYDDQTKKFHRSVELR